MLARLRKLVYSAFVANLKLIIGTEAPRTPKESVRQSLRKTRTAIIPQCPNCQGRTYVEVKTGTLKQKACVFCLTKDSRIVEMV